jgi:Leucine-rich repeat (LRR) protein
LNKFEILIAQFKLRNLILFLTLNVKFLNFFPPFKDQLTTTPAQPQQPPDDEETSPIPPTLPPIDTIACTFSFFSFVYNCELLINNPNGRDDFTTIDGTHLDGHADNSVQSLRANLQVSFNFPSIICERFFNLTTIDVDASELVELTARSFANCQQLVILNLRDNKVKILPSNLVINNRLLARIDLTNNEIADIEPNAFTGSQISTLSLANNKMTAIESHTFGDLSQLRFFYLGDNPIEAISGDAFASLSSVDLIVLDNCGIKTLPAGLFGGLNELRNLHLGNNDIERLEPGEKILNLINFYFILIYFIKFLFIFLGIFSSPSLVNIHMVNNRLSVIDSRHFTSTDGSLGPLPILNIIELNSNRITAIDPLFFDSSPNLNLLALGGNLCIDENFWGVWINRDVVREQLSECFQGWNQIEDEVFIRCDFVVGWWGGVDCTLLTHNPDGRDDFEVIEGELLSFWRKILRSR